MKQFMILFIVAMVIEAIVEYAKQGIKELECNTKLVLAVTVALGILTAVAFDADLFTLLGYEARIPYIGCILTGIVCARGSNYLYDLVGKFTDGLTDCMKGDKK